MSRFHSPTLACLRCHCSKQCLFFSLITPSLFTLPSLCHHQEIYTEFYHLFMETLHIVHCIFLILSFIYGIFAHCSLYIPNFIIYLWNICTLFLMYSSYLYSIMHIDAHNHLEILVEAAKELIRWFSAMFCSGMLTEKPIEYIIHSFYDNYCGATQYRMAVFVMNELLKITMFLHCIR